MDETTLKQSDLHVNVFWDLRSHLWWCEERRGSVWAGFMVLLLKQIGPEEWEISMWHDDYRNPSSPIKLWCSHTFIALWPICIWKSFQVDGVTYLEECRDQIGLHIYRLNWTLIGQWCPTWSNWCRVSGVEQKSNGHWSKSPSCRNSA